MAYKITDPQHGYQPVSVISTVKNHPLGTEIQIVDPDLGAGRAVYVSFKANTAVAAGIVLVPDVNAAGGTQPFAVEAAPTAGSSGDPVYVNLTAVASNAAVQYGWVLIIGIAPTLKTAVKPLAASTVNISGTAGRVYITNSATKQIIGARFVQVSVTTTTSLVNIYFNRASFQGL